MFWIYVMDFRAGSHWFTEKDMTVFCVKLSPGTVWSTVLQPSFPVSTGQQGTLHTKNLSVCWLTLHLQSQIFLVCLKRGAVFLCPLCGVKQTGLQFSNSIDSFSRLSFSLPPVWGLQSPRWVALNRLPQVLGAGKVKEGGGGLDGSRTAGSLLFSQR